MFFNLTSIDKLTEVGGAPTCALPCLLETILPLIVYLTVYFTLTSSLSQDDRITVGKIPDMDQQRHTEGQRTLTILGLPEHQKMPSQENHLHQRRFPLRFLV